MRNQINAGVPVCPMPIFAVVKRAIAIARQAWWQMCYRNASDAATLIVETKWQIGPPSRHIGGGYYWILDIGVTLSVTRPLAGSTEVIVE